MGGFRTKKSQNRCRETSHVQDVRSRQDPRRRRRQDGRGPEGILRRDGKAIGREKVFRRRRQTVHRRFWVTASVYSWERNTKGKESQSHVYAAYNAAMKETAPVLTAWADRMESELKEYIANRRSGTL